MGNKGLTCDLLDNPYVVPHPHQGEGDRIDYILYRARNENVKCLEAYPTLHKVPNNPLGLHYSDHLAVYALLEIDEKTSETKSIPLNNVELIDEDTRENLRSACIIVEESIQRIQRHRLFCLIALIFLLFILFSFNHYLLTIFKIFKNLFCLIGIVMCVWNIALGKPMERNALRSVQNAMHIRLQTSHFNY